MRVNEGACDIHDVTRSASDLVALGCSIGLAHIPDGFARLRFGSMVSAYVDEVIQAVDEGVISAWQALEEIRAEYEGLSSKARFYLQNGVGVVAGAMQIRTGVLVIGSPGALGAVPGGLMVGHGVNNIYEGLGNIYRGPDAPSTVGPVRGGAIGPYSMIARGTCFTSPWTCFFLLSVCLDRFQSQDRLSCSGVIQLIMRGLIIRWGNWLYLLRFWLMLLR